jgi:uncharacterized Tic20 family protein
MMTEAAPPVAATAIPNQEERVLAGISHLAFMTGFPIIGPLAIYFFKKDASRFVSFHALQATFLAIGAIPATFVIWIVAMAIEIGLAVTFKPLELAPLFGLAWIATIGLPFALFFLVSLVAALKAFHGQTWSIPVVGGLAKSILDAPAGTAAPPADSSTRHEKSANRAA